MTTRFVFDAQADHLGFVQSQVSYHEPTVYRRRYADIQYARVLPISREAPEWVKSITHYSSDMVGGQTRRINSRSTDMPLAGVTRDKHEVTVDMAGIGYDYDIEEIAQAQMLGIDFTADKAMAARRDAEQYVDDIAMNGDAELGWDGFINNSNVTSVEVAQGAGTGTPRDWASKEPDEIIADVNNVISGLWVDTKQVSISDTLLIPPSAMQNIASRRLTDSSMTIAQFLMASNMYTAVTQRPLTIMTLRGLEDAGTGTNTNGQGRMIAYRRDPEVLRFHMPMPHRFLPVYRASWGRYVIPGIFRIGGLEIRLPGEIRYADGITPAP